MLVPVAARLQAKGDARELRQLFLSASQSGLFISLPMMVFLALCGQPLIELWMGADYADPWLITLIVLGFLPDIALQPLRSILLGLNSHGYPAVATLVTSLLSVTLVFCSFKFQHSGLLGVAVALGIPWFLLHGWVLPFLACRRLSVSGAEFLRQACLRPALCVLPMGFYLISVRWWFPNNALVAVALGFSGSAVLLGVIYWIWVLPSTWKNHLKRSISAVRSSVVVRTFSNANWMGSTRHAGDE
jgi:Na+-driven multidrug efflux pump